MRRAAGEDHAIDLIAEPGQDGLQEHAEDGEHERGDCGQIGRARAQRWWYTAQHTASLRV